MTAKIAVFVTWLCLLIGGAVPLQAQSADDVPEISMKRAFGGGVTLSLPLDRQVPFRVRHHDHPMRISLDVKTVLPDVPDIAVGRITGVRTQKDEEWSRIWLILDRPVVLAKAGYDTDNQLVVRFSHADFSQFADRIERFETDEGSHEELPLIALDPGHGGIDPGATREGVFEKDVTLAFGTELAQMLENSGRYRVMLTRKDDSFVSLGARAAAARQQGADLFISLHANTVAEGDVSGATVYMLSEVASDAGSAARAAFENSSDDYVGAHTHPEDSDIADVILHMNQSATAARSDIAAKLLIEHLDLSVGVVPNNPLKSANFKVLRAPDMPSILLEFGFMSNQNDLEKMQNAAWRAEAANAVLAMLDRWQAEDHDRLMLTDTDR